MNQTSSKLSAFLFFADLLFTLLGLYVAMQLRVLLPFGASLPARNTLLPWPVYPLALLCWSGSLMMASAYDPRRVLRAVDEIRRVLMASMLATLLLAGALYLTYREVSRLQFIYFFLVNLVLLLGYRGTLRVYYRLMGKSRHQAGVRRVLIVGAGEVGRRAAEAVQQHSRWGFQLVGFLDDDPLKQGMGFQVGQYVSVLGTVDDLIPVVRGQGINEVWIALPARAYRRLWSVVAELQAEPVRIKVIPAYFSLALVQVRPEVFGGIPIVGLREPVIEGFPRLLKRGFDILASGALLILLSPLMLLFAILIRLDSPGAVLFRQQRVGENGRLFAMFKFRTMVTDAEERQAEVVVEDEHGTLTYKRRDDPRVTRIGRVLRRTSFDELPQLFNVLRGDMSLVGPRPELPWLVERYEPWQRKRFAVPQGITGWWQVKGRSDKPMHLNTEDDLYYVYNYSFWLDLKILFETVPAVLKGNGAY